MDDLKACLALPDSFKIERVIDQAHELTLVIDTQTQTSSCPDCGCPSCSKHGYYWRSPRDLPVTQSALQLQIRVHRFRCANPACPRRTFGEDITPYVPRFSRRTQRATHLLSHLGFELGGQAGARVASLYHLSVSRCTLLRLVRRSLLPPRPEVEVLGVDDWAFCRSERYGTILVDLARRHVLELLPDTEATTLAVWLQAHPHIRVISRDRAGNYAEGGRQGAPNALQVADRWHLLRNLWEALVLAFDPYTVALRQLATEQTSPTIPLPESLASVRASTRPKAPPTPVEQARGARRQYWETVFAQVHQLRAQGLSQSAIAKQLGISRSLVKKYGRMDRLPKKGSPKAKPLLIEPYLHDLRRLLQQGMTSSSALLEALRALGFCGSRSTLYKALVGLRQELHLPSPLLMPKTPIQTVRVTPRQLASWLMAPKLSALKQDLLHQARDLHPMLDVACGLAQDFVMLIRERKPHHLLPWLEAAQFSQVPSLKQLAQGFLRDFEAIYAACSQPWSNGQVEGQIHRLKLLKRQMYGRANFDLLRLRVLYFGVITT